MGRRSGAIALAVSMLSLSSAGPAPAHADWRMIGYQYVIAGFGGVGGSGYVNTFVGPVPVGPAVTDDGIASLTNHDPVDHTFTHCTSGCDAADPSAAGARFDIDVPAGRAADQAGLDAIDALPAGDYVIFCRAHPTAMRARLQKVDP